MVGFGVFYLICGWQLPGSLLGVIPHSDLLRLDKYLFFSVNGFITLQCQLKA
jgi:hypothetical protein